MTLRKRTLALCIAALTSPAALASAASTGAPAPVADAIGADDQPTTLDTVQAVGTEPARYHNDASASALGVDAPLFNTPRSVVVLPEQILLDQKVTQLDEALKNVSGVSRGDGFGGTNDDFFLRGFRRDNVYRDGRRLAANQRNPTTDIESIEVIKGPASLLFGAIEPGGVVNIITKKPQAQPRRYLEATFDEYGKRHLLGDFTGALDGDGQLLYRLSASYEDSDTFRDGKQVERTVISPSLTWRPSDRDELTVSYHYYDETLPIDRGAIVGRYADGERRIVKTPRSRSFGESWENSWSTGHSVDAQYQHRFGEHWDAVVGYTYQKTESHDLQVRAYDFYAEDTVVRGIAVPAGTLIRNVGGNKPYDVDSGQYNARLTGRFEPAGMKYTVIAGVDGGYTDTDAGQLNGDNETANVFAGRPLFNVFAPVYGNLQPGSAALSRSSRTDLDFRGVYVQNILQPNEKLLLTAGLRRDWYEVASRTQNYDEGQPAGAAAVADREWSDNSYQLGASYQFAPGLAVYASRATSFTVHPFFNYDPRSLPQTGKQWEAGLKGNLFADRLQFTVSWFDLRKTNIPALNPDSTGSLDQYRFIGEARSRGIEFDATLRITEGFNLIASYADFDYEITRDPDLALLGKTNANVAPRSGNLWGSYEFVDGAWRGLGFGAGVNYVSKRYGDDDNTWSMPSYTLFDAGVWYYVPVGDNASLRFQLSVKNLADKRWYYASDGDRFAPSVRIGDPRTALFSVAYRF
ncbi:TonB-dependent receptor [Lysobacter enzymogenes]|uniref:TonB-dependent siderophore receptor n=1 Tax=Lysobacter enzymogenes TaxID=69 RepID=UPI00374A033B